MGDESRRFRYGEATTDEEQDVDHAVLESIVEEIDLVNNRNDQEEQIHHENHAISGKYLGYQHVLPDLESISLIERNRGRGYRGNEIKKDDVENPLDEGEARQHEHHQYHDGAQKADDVVAFPDVVVLLHSGEVRIIQLPTYEHLLDIVSLRSISFVRIVSYCDQKLSSYRSVCSIEIPLHRLVDGSHDNVRQKNSGQYGERDDDHDDKALKVLRHHGLPVLLFLIARAHDGDYGEHDQENRSYHRDNQKRPFDFVGIHEGGKEVSVFAVDIYRIDAAQLVEDGFDEINQHAYPGEAAVKDAEEEVGDGVH